MHITLFPVRMDTRPTITRSGDTLTIDGEAFDFSAVPDGATLPKEAINSDWFTGPVERIAGTLHLNLRLSHGANAPEETRFPEPITLTSDGPLELPVHDIELEVEE
jgi:hypothetical protein